MNHPVREDTFPYLIMVRVTRTWELWGGVIVAAVLAIPLSVAVIPLLARRRARAGHPAPARTALADVGIVEALQYGLRLGRFASIDDVLLNTLGAVLAALVTRRSWARRTADRAVSP